MIRISNLSKSYGTKQVLKNVNLSFEKGKVYGIVGKNGAGKTSFFNCLADIETYEGSIESDFTNIKNHIGLLETNPIFLSRITSWEYLKLFCRARNIHEENFESKNIFDLPLNQYAETYSTGMKKKLALMAILLQKNDVFILDEPFNGVDIQSNILITTIIDKLRAAQKTIVISSHIFSTLSNSCDQIFLLNNGSIEKTVDKQDYETLEAELKQDFVENQLDRLEF